VSGSTGRHVRQYTPSRKTRSAERKAAEAVVNALNTRLPFSYSAFAYEIIQSGEDINGEFMKVISAYLEAQAERVEYPEMLTDGEYNIAIHAKRIVDALKAFVRRF